MWAIKIKWKTESEWITGDIESVKIEWFQMRSRFYCSGCYRFWNFYVSTYDFFSRSLRVCAFRWVQRWSFRIQMSYYRKPKRKRTISMSLDFCVSVELLCIRLEFCLFFLSVRRSSLSISGTCHSHRICGVYGFTRSTIREK